MSSTDFSPSYQSPGVFGCKHYKRGCKIIAKCCGNAYTCRFCHDENESHEINRYETEQMICMHCGVLQRANKFCSNCNADLGRYFCSICKFWNNDPNTAIYHCMGCGLCRVGKGLGIDFFHCNTCKACLAISMKDSHQCRDGLLMNKCPVCWEMLFNSTWPTSVLTCGHAIHKKCLEMYMKNQNMNCPICFKPLYDIQAIKNAQIALFRTRLRQNFGKLLFFIFVVFLLLYRLFIR